mgnify:FL=1
MTRVEQLEHEIKKLNRADFEVFRNWFLEYEADAWDRQMEEDVQAGKLDKLAEEALAAHKAGRTKEL